MRLRLALSLFALTAAPAAANDSASISGLESGIRLHQPKKIKALLDQSKCFNRQNDPTSLFNIGLQKICFDHPVTNQEKKRLEKILVEFEDHQTSQDWLFGSKKPQLKTEGLNEYFTAYQTMQQIGCQKEFASDLLGKLRDYSAGKKISDQDKPHNSTRMADVLIFSDVKNPEFQKPSLLINAHKDNPSEIGDWDELDSLDRVFLVIPNHYDFCAMDQEKLKKDLDNLLKQRTQLEEVQSKNSSKLPIEIPEDVYEVYKALDSPNNHVFKTLEANGGHCPQVQPYADMTFSRFAPAPPTDVEMIFDTKAHIKEMCKNDELVKAKIEQFKQTVYQEDLAYPIITDGFHSFEYENRFEEQLKAEVDEGKIDSSTYMDRLEELALAAELEVNGLDKKTYEQKYVRYNDLIFKFNQEVKEYNQNISFISWGDFKTECDFIRQVQSAGISFDMQKLTYQGLPIVDGSTMYVSNIFKAQGVNEIEYQGRKLSTEDISDILSEAQANNDFGPLSEIQRAVHEQYPNALDNDQPLLRAIQVQDILRDRAVVQYRKRNSIDNNTFVQVDFSRKEGPEEVIPSAECEISYNGMNIDCPGKTIGAIGSKTFR